ncbi:MAG: hypothetical protein QOJ51_6755 [Acidobacteriaceae bacterium]|nr:hypothetical protein [Acidobacteriaceae bacterium]
MHIQQSHPGRQICDFEQRIDDGHPEIHDIRQLYKGNCDRFPAHDDQLVTARRVFSVKLFQPRNHSCFTSGRVDQPVSSCLDWPKPCSRT